MRINGLRVSKCRLSGAVYDAGTTVWELEDEGLRLYHYTNNGEHLPNCGTMRAICTRLGVSAEYLLGLSDRKEPRNRPPKPPSIEERLVELSKMKMPVREQRRRYMAMHRLRQGGDLHLATAKRIADAHGCSLDYVLGLEE